MGLLDNASMVDAKRFEEIAHASVMRSGRLRFATDAMEMMDLAGVKSIILFSLSDRNNPSGEIEYGAVTCHEGDARGFAVKASGPYRYISLKNFLIQEGINFKDYSITFEVTDANEQWEGKPVFRLTMRRTPKANVGQQILPGVVETISVDDLEKHEGRK